MKKKKRKGEIDGRRKKAKRMCGCRDTFVPSTRFGNKFFV